MASPRCHLSHLSLYVPIVIPRHTHLGREYHRFANTCGSQVQVVTGMGMGGSTLPLKKPTPMGGLHYTNMGFTILVYLQHVQLFLHNTICWPFH